MEGESGLNLRNLWFTPPLIGIAIYSQAWVLLLASVVALAIVLILALNERGAALIQLVGWVVVAVAVYLTGWLVVQVAGLGALVGGMVWSLLFAAVGYARGRSPTLYAAVAFVFFIVGGLILLVVPADHDVARERRSRLAGHRADRVECRHCARLNPLDQEFCRCGNRLRGPVTDRRP